MLVDHEVLLVTQELKNCVLGADVVGERLVDAQADVADDCAAFDAYDVLGDESVQQFEQQQLIQQPRMPQMQHW